MVFVCRWSLTQHRFDCITKHFKMFIILNQILMCRKKEMDNFI